MHVNFTSKNNNNNNNNNNIYIYSIFSYGLHVNQFKRREKIFIYIFPHSVFSNNNISLKKNLKIKHLEEMNVGFSMVTSGWGRGIKK